MSWGELRPLPTRRHLHYPSATPSSVELHTAYETLRLSLSSPSPPTAEVLVEQLRRVLRAPALGALAVYQQAEYALANLLAATLPNSDPLLIECITHFRWDPHARVDNSSIPAVNQVLARCRLLEFQWNLQNGKHSLSAAYRRLQTRSSSWQRLIQATSLQSMHPTNTRCCRFSAIPIQPCWRISTLMKWSGGRDTPTAHAFAARPGKSPVSSGVLAALTMATESERTLLKCFIALFAGSGVIYALGVSQALRDRVAAPPAEPALSRATALHG